MKHYEAPRIESLGTIEEFTQASRNGNRSDGRRRRRRGGRPTS